MNKNNNLPHILLQCDDINATSNNTLNGSVVIKQEVDEKEHELDVDTNWVPSVCKQEIVNNNDKKSSKKNRSLSICEKKRAIKAVEDGQVKKDVAMQFGISPSTLSMILKNRDRVIGSDLSDNRKRSRQGEHPHLEECLLEWIKEQNVHVGGVILKEKAKSYAESLGIQGFAASEGWLTNFKSRHASIFKKNCDEIVSMEEEPPATLSETPISTQRSYALIMETDEDIKEEIVTVDLPANEDSESSIISDAGKPTEQNEMLRPNDYSNIRSMNRPIPTHSHHMHSYWKGGTTYDERLIELVRQSPCLYDLKDREYLDSERKKAIWNEIGVQLNADGRKCRTRWLNIRDTFRRSLAKRNTVYGDRIKPYKFERQLQFLTTAMTMKASNSNITAVPPPPLQQPFKNYEEKEIHPISNESPVFSYSSQPKKDATTSSTSLSSSLADAQSSEQARKRIKSTEEKKTNETPASRLADFLINKFSGDNGLQSTGNVHRPLFAWLAEYFDDLPPEYQTSFRQEILLLTIKYDDLIANAETNSN